ncbi:MAG TPA: efflux RND transporter periplasmic adaptor subunit [Candidatus Cloacimonadota bacterium]|nr:efflux RND transporter periplasmic adaptor subunit [Candidatus Cloacimonadota bacterium]
MARKKGLMYGIIFIIIVLFLFIIVTGNKARKSEKKDLVIPISVLTAKMTVGPIQEDLKYTGTLEGKEQATVLSQTAGVVETVSCTPGQKCRIGQVLGMVENSAQQAGVDQAQAQVMAAETNYEKAQKDMTRIQKLYDDKVTTKDNLELTQLSVKSAFAQLKGAQAALKAIQKQLNDTYLRATINGRVATKLIEIGQTLAPGTPVATLVDDSAFKLKIFVPESNITKINQNDQVNVTVDVIPDKVFKGTVKTVGLAIQGDGNSYPVEISIPKNGDNDLKAGMFACSTIATSKKANAMLIPADAVITNSNQTYVYVVNGTKAAIRNIVVGLKNENYYEVISGIGPNDQIITVGKDQVSDGSPIQMGESK